MKDGPLLAVSGSKISLNIFYKKGLLPARSGHFTVSVFTLVVPLIVAGQGHAFGGYCRPFVVVAQVFQLVPWGRFSGLTGTRLHRDCCSEVKNLTVLKQGAAWISSSRRQEFSVNHWGCGLNLIIRSVKPVSRQGFLSEKLLVWAAPLPRNSGNIVLKLPILRTFPIVSIIENLPVIKKVK